VSVESLQLAGLSVGMLAVLLLVWDKSATGGIGLVAVQAAANGVAALAHAVKVGSLGLAVVVIAGVGVKALLMPWLLRRAARQASVPSETSPRLHTPAALLVAISILAGSVLLFSEVASGGVLLGIALGQGLVGVWVVASRRGALAQITGVVAAETGMGVVLTIAGTSTPVLELLLLGIGLGVFLVLLGLAANVRRYAGTSDVGSLSSLTEYAEEAEA